MSYVPSHAGGLLAQPNALVFIPETASSTQAPVVDTAVELDAAITQFGNWTVSITNDVVTLPSGYFYLIEATVSCYYTGSAGGSDYLTHQIYDETNSTYVGTPATTWRALGEDVQLESRDEKSRYYVDCQSASLDISVKVKAKTAPMNRINYNGDANFSLLAGLGRVVIWRLDP